MVNYPDTEIRLRETIDLLGVLLTKPRQGLIHEVTIDLLELKEYFRDIMEKFPETRKPFYRAYELTNILLS